LIIVNNRRNTACGKRARDNLSLQRNMQACRYTSRPGIMASRIKRLPATGPMLQLRHGAAVAIPLGFFDPGVRAPG